jgi:hypothetical protein
MKSLLALLIIQFSSLYYVFIVHKRFWSVCSLNKELLMEIWPNEVKYDILIK